MRIAESIERNGLDVQLADLERMVGAAVASGAETGEPVALRFAEAVAQFGGVFVPQKPKSQPAPVRSADAISSELQAIQAPKRPLAG